MKLYATCHCDLKTGKIPNYTYLLCYLNLFQIYLIRNKLQVLCFSYRNCKEFDRKTKKSSILKSDNILMYALTSLLSEVSLQVFLYDCKYEVHTYISMGHGVSNLRIQH